MTESLTDKQQLYITIENGIIDFNGLINRVAELESNIKAINEAVQQLDQEIIYLIDQDNKTNEVLMNHASVVHSLKEHLEDIKRASECSAPTKLHISCKLVHDE